MCYQWLVHSHRLCRVTVRHIRSEPRCFCCTYDGAAAEQEKVWSQTLRATTQRNHWTMHVQIYVFLITFGICRSWMAQEIDNLQLPSYSQWPRFANTACPR